MERKDELRALEAKVAALEIVLIAFMDQAPEPAKLLQRLNAIQRDPQVSRFPAICQHLNRLAHRLAQQSSAANTPHPDTH